MVVVQLLNFIKLLDDLCVPPEEDGIDYNRNLV